MTTNQIAYQNLKETERSNRAKEAETNRANLAKEAETFRSNVAEERLKAVEGYAKYPMTYTIFNEAVPNQSVSSSGMIGGTPNTTIDIDQLLKSDIPTDLDRYVTNVAGPNWKELVFTQPGIIRWIEKWYRDRQDEYDEQNSKHGSGGGGSHSR